MRATSMSIAYIKKYVHLCLKGKDTIPERRQIILNQKEIIELHIKEYQDLLKVVTKKLKHYDHIVESETQIINPLKD